MTDIFALETYDYELPDGLIATHPASPRDAARLLVWGDQARHKIFSDIVDELSAGDVLVVNNSRVIPARLHGVRPKRDETTNDVAVEILLHRPMADASEWRVFARPAKRLRHGDIVQFPGDITAEIIGRLEEQVTLKFNLPPEQVFAFLDAHGEVPLPPYIERQAEYSDVNEYQTVYAHPEAHGSVAAPTAGLHFTDELLEKIKAKGVIVCEVTLHVGAGTFLSVMTDDIRAHKMHAEWGEIDAATAEIINRAKQNGHNIIAVGTTATRVLETAARATGQIAAWSGETDIFITPGFQFNVVDKLITNFHLPKSTLLMLVSALLGGVEKMKALYKIAIDEKYRFYSYGDACLLTRG